MASVPRSSSGWLGISEDGTVGTERLTFEDGVVEGFL